MTLQDCLKRADKLGAYILKSQKPIRDAVFMHQCGSVPRLTMDERIASMSEDELHAMEMIGQMSMEYEGLFADFTPQTPKAQAYVPKPEISPEVKAETKTRAKASKKCLRDTKKLATCIVNLTDSNRSEPVVKAATAVCLCGGMNETA